MESNQEAEIIDSFAKEPDIDQQQAKETKDQSDSIESISNTEEINKINACMERLSIEDYILSMIHEIIHQSTDTVTEYKAEENEDIPIKKSKKDRVSLVQPKVFTNRINKSKTEAFDQEPNSKITLTADQPSNDENKKQKAKKISQNFIERNKQKMKEQEEKRKQKDLEKKKIEEEKQQKEDKMLGRDIRRAQARHNSPKEEVKIPVQKHEKPSTKCKDNLNKVATIRPKTAYGKFDDLSLEELDNQIKKKKMENSLKLKQKEIEDEKIHLLNEDKPKNNFCKISKWLQITIMLFLDEGDIIKTGSACKSLNEASNDEYIWRQKLIYMRGKLEFSNLSKEFHNITNSEERIKAGLLYKHKCLRQMNAKHNFTKSGFKPSVIKLMGHNDTIRGLDSLGEYVLSGGEDNMVKLWNLSNKKCKTYGEHMNWVTCVLLLDNYVISGFVFVRYFRP